MSQGVGNVRLASVVLQLPDLSFKSFVIRRLVEINGGLALVLNLITAIWVSLGPIVKARARPRANPMMDLFQLSKPPGAATMLVDSSRMRAMSATSGHTGPEKYQRRGLQLNTFQFVILFNLENLIAKT